MGSYGRELASTGTGIYIGHLFINQNWILAVAVGVIVLGALFIRLGWRRNKGVGEA